MFPTPRITSLAEAVRDVLSPGSQVYLGNFGAQLFSVGDEIVRQRLDQLDVICGSGGLLLDKLIGAGAARSVLFSHCWNPLGPRPAHNLRRAAEQGHPEVQIRELSLGMLAMAFQAAAWGVPYLPVNLADDAGYWSDDWSGGLLGTAESEFGTTRVVRALRPDVAFVHVDCADPLGNAVLTQPHGEHLVAAMAARTTVVVAEEIVDHPRDLPAVATLAGVHVDLVVRHPGAVAPDGTPGRYPRDVASYIEYADMSHDPARFAAEIAQLQEEAR